MRGLLEVKLVDEGLPGDVFGPAVIAIAAIVAAMVAAYVASRNHRQQLEHDRRERQREDTRKVLDAAIETVISTLAAFGDFGTAITSAEARRASLEEKRDGEIDADQRSTVNAGIGEIAAELSNANDGLESVLRELAASNARLALRFGVEAGIPIAYEEFSDSYEAYRATLVLGVDSNRTDAEKADAEKKDKRTDDAFVSLMHLCESWHTGSAEEPSVLRRLLSALRRLPARFRRGSPPPGASASPPDR